MAGRIQTDVKIRRDVRQDAWYHKYIGTYRKCSKSQQPDTQVKSGSNDTHVTHSSRILTRLVKLPSKMRAHRRPFMHNYAVNTAIPHRAILCSLVGTENSVKFCSEPLYSLATLMIQEMRAKLHGNAANFIKCMLEQNEFCVGVQPVSLHAE